MPDDSSLKKRLLALATASERTAFERIRDVFPEIEQAINAGVQRAQIVDALRAEGIDITPKVFTNYVLRIKALRAKGSVRPTRGPEAPEAAE